MKKLLAFAAFLSVVSFIEPPEVLSAEGIKTSFGKIKEHVYMSKYEVSNADYLCFLGSLQGDNVQYISAMPDTTVWLQTLNGKAPTAFYLRQPAFAQYPVVGVSYENAEAYCKWLTDNYNTNRSRRFDKVIFRLPTTEEWTLAANGGNEKKQYPWGNGFTHNSRNMALCNYSELIQPTNADNHPIFKLTSPVKSFYPSSHGLYNMSGNVAEMVAEKGIAKGGSYSDPAWEVTIAAVKKYTKPTADIGFRVVMEVVDTP